MTLRCTLVPSHSSLLCPFFTGRTIARATAILALVTCVSFAGKSPNTLQSFGVRVEHGRIIYPTPIFLLFAVVAGIWLLGRLATVLAILTIALVLVGTFDPLVAWLERRGVGSWWRLGCSLRSMGRCSGICPRSRGRTT